MKVFDKDKSAHDPCDNKVCQFCVNAQNKNGILYCPLRANYTDIRGNIDKNQPYLEASKIKVCEVWQYSLDWEKIFKELKEK